MGALDVDAALRWFRFARERSISRRGDAALPFLEEEPGAGAPLLLDTCVYVDQMRGSTPDALDQLFLRRRLYHSAVAVQELLHLVGVLDPRDSRTAGAIERIIDAVRAMRAHRIVVPEIDTLARSALLAGLLCRLQGYAQDRRRKALADCTLFLQARKHGLTVLTRNIADFDYLLQLIPTGRVLFYRNR